MLCYRLFNGHVKCTRVFYADLFVVLISIIVKSKRIGTTSTSLGTVLRVLFICFEITIYATNIIAITARGTNMQVPQTKWESTTHYRRRDQRIVAKDQIVLAIHGIFENTVFC